MASNTWMSPARSPTQAPAAMSPTGSCKGAITLPPETRSWPDGWVASSWPDRDRTRWGTGGLAQRARRKRAWPRADTPAGSAWLAVAVEIRDLPLLHRAQDGDAGHRQRGCEQRRPILPRHESGVPQLRGECGLRYRDDLQPRAASRAQRANQAGHHIPERQVGRATNRVERRDTGSIGSTHRSEEHTSELQSQSNLVC